MARARRVRLQNRQRRLKVDADRIRRLAGAVLTGEGAPESTQVEVVLLRDAPIAVLNATYRKRTGPTDVLSFPMDDSAWPPDEPPLLGTVVISVDRALAQATERRLAPHEEIERLLVHGLLHLLGHTHTAARERGRMRRRETHYLTRTGGR